MEKIYENVHVFVQILSMKAQEHVHVFMKFF